MQKYELLPQQLVHEGIVEPGDLFSPGVLAEEHTVAVHDETYWLRVKHDQLTPQEIRRTGFPYSTSLIERETRIAQGSIEAASYALKDGVAFNIAGGTHHAGIDFGEGFCILNDIAIAAQYLLDHTRISKILVIDLDVHQGNGTAHIFQEHAQVVTFSMHGEHNFPLKKIPSNLDVALPDNTEDQPYLQLLDSHLKGYLKEVAADFIFFQAGVDVLGSDTLGRLSLSHQACQQRDRLVLEFARHHNIPVAIVMGGGYSPQLKHILEAHANTYRVAKELYF